MGVYIKGMKMPTCCGDCCLAFHIGMDKLHCRITGKSFDVWAVGWGSEDNRGEDGQRPYIRHDDCPLIELPPHGRLIDAYELTIEILKLQKYRFSIEDSEIFVSRKAVMQAISDNPTVIEAEGESE